jgi:hypothetical protein
MFGTGGHINILIVYIYIESQEIGLEDVIVVLSWNPMFL